MAAKDFSIGRRLRIRLDAYDRATRQFRPCRGVAALITVHDINDQRRLWAHIDAAILAFQTGEDDDDDLDRPDAGPVGARAGR